MDTLQSHYARLLGLDDTWRIEAVDLQIEDRRVEIRLSHVGAGVIRPECGVACGLADHADKGRWRHLDTMQFVTELVARLPRSRCAGQRHRFNSIRKHGLKTARAWGITDMFRWFWRHVYSTRANRFFKRRYAQGDCAMMGNLA